MRLVVIADLHSSIEQFKKFKNKFKPKPDDILIIAGDLVEGNTQEPLELEKDLIKSLRRKFEKIMMIPGNVEPKEVRKWLLAQPENLHSRGKLIGEIGFFGFGGAKTPFETPFEPEEIEVRRGLEKGYKAIEGAEKKIMVVHNPPKNTKLDRISDGTHVGSQAIREAIQEYQTQLVICAHIHESFGKARIGESLVYYPGPLSEGRIGIVELERMETETIVLD